MYHTRKVTNPVNKVYTLFNIGSYSLIKLLADYRVIWEVVFKRLIKLSLFN